MGVQFGNLPIRIRRIVYYSLSPLEQRIWAKSVTHGIPNILRRVMRLLPPIIPAFTIGIVVVTWANAAHDRYTRKDPKLYENDK